MATGFLSPIGMITQLLSDQGIVGSGYKINTYVGGSVNTPVTTYTDSTLTVPNSNPIIMGSNGRFQSVSVWGPSGTVIKMVITDASNNLIAGGTVDNIPLINDTALPTWFLRTAGEIAAGITPVNLGYPPGDLRRYGGSGDNGTTDNTTPLQSAISANAGAGFVYVPNMGGYFKITARVTAPANTHIVLEEGAELRWTATTANGTNFLGTATRPGIEVQGDNFLIEGRGKITGPATAAAGSGAGGGGVTALVINEFGILRVGASAASRGTGMVIRDVEISLWGQGGWATQYMQDLQMVGANVHDVGYQGMVHLSGQHILVHRNKVYGIAPGTAGNAYGMTFSHDSTNYNNDPLVGAPISAITQAASAVITITTVSGSNPYSVGQNVGVNSATGMTAINGLYGTVTAIGGVSGAWTITTNINSGAFGAYVGSGVLSCPRQATNPFCIDVDVGYNEVRDVPLWNGIDSHGAYDTQYHHNRVYNCHRGLQLSGSSNAGGNYAGENNYVTDNVVYGFQINGNPTTDVSGFQAGLVVNGGSVTQHRSVVVRNNSFFGLGHANVTPTVYVLECTLCQGLVVQGNTFRDCVGRMIYFSNTSGEIKDNYFGSMGSSITGSNLIYADSNSGPLSVTGNIHSTADGTGQPSTNGLNAPGSGYTRFTVTGNDFSACTNAYVNFNGTFTRNLSDVTPYIVDSTTGSHTVDASVIGQAPRFAILANQSGVATLTSILNPSHVGQECRIIMTGSSTLTVNNSGNIKLQGGTAAVTSSSELTLVYDGTKWEEVSRSLGNT
jgi:hypothetical protein